MLGMRRPPPPFSLDDLELERSAIASKVSKNQTLSIYESTLEKLRQGSRRAFKMIEGPKEEPQKSHASPKSMEAEQGTNAVKILQKELIDSTQTK